MTLSDFAGGFALSAFLFFVLAVILAVFASETPFHESAARARRLGWASLSVAVILTLASIWTLVVNGGW